MLPQVSEYFQKCEPGMRLSQDDVNSCLCEDRTEFRGVSKNYQHGTNWEFCFQTRIEATGTSGEDKTLWTE